MSARDERPGGAAAPPGGGSRFLSNVLAVAYKEAAALRHDQAFLGAVLVQPIMMMVLFGFALSYTPANVPWVVLDQSRTAASRGFLEAVQSTGYFLPPRPVDSWDAGEAELRRGAVVAFVVVPADFRRAAERGRPRVQVLLDGTDPITASRVGGIVRQVGAAYAFRGRPDAPPPPAELRQRFRFNPTLRDREFFLSILAGMLLTNICLSVTSLGIVGERESGTFEHMLAQPTTALEIVFGKLAPHVVIGFVVMLVAVVAAGLVFGIWPRGSWVALFLVTLPFILASLAIGVFVSTLASTSAQAVFISVFFILPSFVLSGSMIPYQLMPPGIREVGYLLPLRWYQIALRRITERGAGLAEVAVPLLALCGLFAVLLLLIRWRMRPRLA
jgi:ABC-2 type transport system permease protein